jgi:hypothetical protein
MCSPRWARARGCSNQSRARTCRSGLSWVAGTDTVLAVNSYVTNYNCRGVGYSQRVDVPDVLSWIAGSMG